MPVALTNPRSRWPDSWAPRDDEEFHHWCDRNSNSVPPLDLRVYEQWVFRHWDASEYFGLPLGNFDSCEERIATDILLTIGAGGSLLEDRSAESSRQHYEHMRGNDWEPVRTMNRMGTWDYPILAVRSADGFRYGRRLFQDSLWLVEGHMRMRYLLGLASAGRCSTHHTVLVLSLR